MGINEIMGMGFNLLACGIGYSVMFIFMLVGWRTVHRELNPKKEQAETDDRVSILWPWLPDENSSHKGTGR